MNIETVNELIQSLESAGELSIKETKVMALVEALEKAQTKAIEQGRTACELFDEVTALRQRIAELESRIVTVKLPVSLDFDCEMENGDYDIDEEPYLRGKVYGFNYALTKVRRLNGTAGIKWEAE